MLPHGRWLVPVSVCRSFRAYQEKGDLVCVLSFAHSWARGIVVVAGHDQALPPFKRSPTVGGGEMSPRQHLLPFLSPTIRDGILGSMLVGRVPYRQGACIYIGNRDVMGGFWLGFLMSPPPLQPLFFGSSLMLFLNLREEESGGKGREGVCVCFYLSWWRSFQGASARDNAKGVEIMKLMTVCIMRDKNLDFILGILVNGERCLCCVT
ncbi:hypothetical protein F5144DRAFT_102509 [Chaetomium tenue]|uniref:Uncharacterized protein n=1 Tax=Chaetomium tenue TaxID=1854479 RepID=A0ACB7PF69_9PEZI|nr:hypothetical protein F5144DRAFT_102509 [Chaetomium globosum]